jgi:putative ABC transport system permease protein
MLNIALSQVRSHARRFIAVGLAVVLAVAFLSATLMVNATTQASLGASLGAAYAKADLVVTSDEPLNPAAADAALRDPAVEAAYVRSTSLAAFGTGRNAAFAQMANTAPETLEATQLLEGSLPSGPGELALDAATADKYGVDIGDVLSIAPGTGASAQQDLDDAGAAATVVGIVAPSPDPFLAALPQLLAEGTTVASLAGGEPAIHSIQLDLAAGTGSNQAADAVARLLEGAGYPNLTVRTADEQTTAVVQSLTGGSDQLTIILLAFALVAVLVSALVISNTFSVLVAQRTRELALLRCIGSSRRQIRNSVLAEAAVVGSVASVAGVLLATGVMAGLVSYARTIPGSEFATLAVPPSAIITGLAAGILMTLVAASFPARAATAVAPLAALRPADDAALGNRKGRLRLALGLVLLAGGAALLAAGAASGQLLVALPGGALSFVGILLCAVLFVPALVSGTGRLAAGLGVPGQLAAANAVRNPARTSSTAAALLIGVTLVTMMMTGAASARTGFDNALDESYPVDVAIGGPTLAGGPLADGSVTAAREVPGVQDAALLQPAGTLENTGTLEAAGQEPGGPVPVLALPEGKNGLLRDDALVLDADTILMPAGTAADTLTVTGARGQAELRVVTSEADDFPPLISAAVMEQLGGPAADAASELWLSVEPDLSGGELMDLRTELASVVHVNDYQVSGAAVEKATFNEVIDVLLLVVTALLAVAVLIALIGVANTLSLSVLERTRESALLRALGLTKGQLRGMLAVEAVLIAGVAALLGTVLGSAYGVLGAQAALGAVADVVPVLPWTQLAAVLGVAIVAGLLASVLPARRAVRLSPVEGLATT